MSEITLKGSQAPIGRLSVEPSEDGTRVCLTFTMDGPTEMTTTLSLALEDAEAVSGMLSQAIEDVSATIEALTEMATTTRASEPESELVGVGADMPF